MYSINNSILLFYFMIYDSFFMKELNLRYLILVDLNIV